MAPGALQDGRVETYLRECEVPSLLVRIALLVRILQSCLACHLVGNRWPRGYSGHVVSAGAGIEPACSRPQHLFPADMLSSQSVVTDCCYCVGGLNTVSGAAPGPYGNLPWEAAVSPYPHPGQ